MSAYAQVIDAGTGRHFVNSVVVTLGSVLPIVLFSFLAAYAIVRGIDLIITRIRMYDTLGALILPSIAFGIPLAVLILSDFLRDVSRELFESVRLDGCTNWQWPGDRPSRSPGPRSSPSASTTVSTCGTGSCPR